MIENQEQIHDEFDLKKDQKLIDEFDCLLVNLSPIQGRLCLSEKSIFFIPEDKTKENNISINMDEMTHLGIKDENVKIGIKNMDQINQTYLFSFKEANDVYKKIKSKCKLYNENKEKTNYISLSDEEYTTDDNNKTSCSSNTLNSISLNDVSDKNMFSNTEKKNKNILNDLEEKNKMIRYNSSKNCISKDITKLFEKETEEEKPIIKEKILFNKIDEEIDHELDIKIIDLPPDKIFEKYLTQNNEDTSYEAYYKWSGEYSDIKITDWEKQENKDNKGIEKYKRTENFCISLSNVPLINKSHVEKTMEYWIDKDGTYYLRSISLSKGVPLSDKFNVETHAEFHPYMNKTKTVFRTYVRTNILKWNLFKFVLISQGKKNYIEEINKWIKFIEEKGDKIEGNYCK